MLLGKVLCASCSFLAAIQSYPYDESFLREAFPCYLDYETQELLPQKFQGWYANAEPMRDLIKLVKPKVVIELGAWLGSSTLHIASLLPKDGIVFTVDHWYQPPYNQNIHEWYQQFDIPHLYQQFISNVRHCGLTKKIVPVFGTTQTASELFKQHAIQPDLIYIDADHAEDSVYQDLSTYYPLIKERGVICGDDYYWNLDQSGYPVKKAVDQFAKENNLKIHTPNNWFWYLTE